MQWFDGTSHGEGRIPLDPADRGLLLGDGVFDTSLVLGGKMVWREAHAARLCASCQVLGFTVDAAQVDAAIEAVLAQTKHASLRITVTRGAGPRGVAPPKSPKPVIFAAAAPLRTAALFAPVKLHVTEILRNETSPSSTIKSLSYIDSVLASRDAIAAGGDDALFLNTQGRVACTAIGNVLALIGDQLVTPPVGDGLVAGIARGMVLRMCDEVGLEPVERSLTLPDLKAARAVIVTNSLRLVAPVISIGRHEIGSSASRRVQALVAQIAASIREATGVDTRKLAAS